MNQLQFIQILENAQIKYNCTGATKNGSVYLIVNSISCRVADHVKPNGEVKQIEVNTFENLHNELISRGLDLTCKKDLQAQFYIVNRKNVIKEGIYFRVSGGLFATEDCALWNLWLNKQ
jgi:hypothetical protein